MKKILILGGAQVHCKLVEAAKQKGLYTVVVDNLEIIDSPAKRIADESYMIDAIDVNGIVELCMLKGIDGVLSSHLDPLQLPYGLVCKRLDLPCIGSVEQFNLFTDKKRFKNLCREYGIDTINEYENVDSIEKYPVFVKPVDSRGSRGQTKCNNKSETLLAIEKAIRESKSGKYIIEDYFDDQDEVQLTYFCVDGVVYLIRTADSIKGNKQLGLNNIVTYGISPSEKINTIIESINEKFVNLAKGIGINNGPFMVQGFLVDEKFYVFDQGLRFPGVDYERCYKEVFGTDLLDPLIEFSITGEMPKVGLKPDSYLLNGNCFRTIFPLLNTGEVTKIEGIEKVRGLAGVKALLPRKKVGDAIVDENDIRRRFAEIDILTKNSNEIKELEKQIWNLLHVVDECNNNMLIPWNESLEV